MVVPQLWQRLGSSSALITITDTWIVHCLKLFMDCCVNVESQTVKHRLQLLGPLLSCQTWTFFFPSCLKDKIIESMWLAGVILVHHVDLYLVSFGFGKCQLHYGYVIKFLLKLQHTVATLPLPLHLQLLKPPCWDGKARAGRKTNQRRLEANLSTAWPGSRHHSAYLQSQLRQDLGAKTSARHKILWPTGWASWWPMVAHGGPYTTPASFQCWRV